MTKKGRPFVWGDEQQRAFDEIKSKLLKPPVLSMPDKRGRFLLYSDTSKYATGSALYQVQNRKPKLIAYISKRMPEAAQNYSITELEMCNLTINIASFAHLLKKVDFDTIVDHLAITHIIKSKMEPATNTIKKLLGVLSSYSFNLYYIKGKDMILSDFLSRQIKDDSNPHEIIPISFNIWEILQENYHSILSDTYKMQSRTQANAPKVVNAQPVAQKAGPKIVKLPIKTEKEKDSKTLLSGAIQQPQKGIVMPPEFQIPPIIIPPGARLPPWPPNVDDATTNVGLDPNVISKKIHPTKRES